MGIVNKYCWGMLGLKKPWELANSQQTSLWYIAFSFLRNRLLFSLKLEISASCSGNYKKSVRWISQSISATSGFSTKLLRLRISFFRIRTVLKRPVGHRPATSGRGTFCYAALCLFLNSLLDKFPNVEAEAPLSQSAVGKGFSSLKI